MNNTIPCDQNIRGLEAAYKAVYNRELKQRIAELVNDYPNYPGEEINKLCTELNPDNAVPCLWSISALVKHYNIA